MRTIGPALLAAIGLILLAFCIYTEGEPTAVPLVLLVVAGVWYAGMHFRRRGKTIR